MNTHELTCTCAVAAVKPRNYALPCSTCGGSGKIDIPCPRCSDTAVRQTAPATFHGITNHVPEITLFLAPATFCGVMKAGEGLPDFELWNLTQDIPGFPMHSTVCRKTLEDAGYHVPKITL